MDENGVLLAGTIGQSVWWSEDRGENWTRGKGSLFLESDIRALLSLGAGRVWAGADNGVYESPDGGRTWDRLPHFPAEYQVWSLGVTRPPEGREGHRLWAGTCPAALFYSDDEGQSWTEASTRWLRTCAGGTIRVRVTSILSGESRLWVGAEIDGTRESQDGGEHWRSTGEGLVSQDIHSLARLPGRDGLAAVTYAATNAGLCRRADGEGGWQTVGTSNYFRWPYCRAVTVDQDGVSLLVGNGNGPPGSAGAIWRSPDGGSIWEQEDLPCAPNSTVWSIVVTPQEVWAFSVLGQLFRRAPGRRWEKLPHEFGEIRALCVIP